MSQKYLTIVYAIDEKTDVGSIYRAHPWVVSSHSHAIDDVRALQKEVAAAQGGAPGRWLVVNIGCIECGVSTALVGRFDSKELAQAVANECAREHGWREGGQNDFQVFDLDAPCNSEYAEAIARAAGGCK